MNSSISAIIIINPQWFDAMEQLPQALNSTMWCQERILSTSAITGKLQKIASKYKSKIVLQSGSNFSHWRFNSSKEASNDWILFVDADEVVTPDLAQEINKKTSQNDFVAFAIPRLNYILNRPMKHSGWWPDYVMRLIYRPNLISYQGEVHEQPQILGQTSHLHNFLKHYKHTHLEDMVTKTQTWSNTEGQLLFESNHPPMKSYRFIRPFLSQIWSRIIIKRGFMDKTEGIIDGIYQAFSKSISYTKLWELQQNHK